VHSFLTSYDLVQFYFSSRRCSKLLQYRIGILSKRMSFSMAAVLLAIILSHIRALKKSAVLGAPCNILPLLYAIVFWRVLNAFLQFGISLMTYGHGTVRNF